MRREKALRIWKSRYDLDNMRPRLWFLHFMICLCKLEFCGMLVGFHGVEEKYLDFYHFLCWKVHQTAEKCQVQKIGGIFMLPRNPWWLHKFVPKVCLCDAFSSGSENDFSESDFPAFHINSMFLWSIFQRKWAWFLMENDILSSVVNIFPMWSHFP